ncbi:Ig-like domain-containing protein [Leptospira brenneri]|uniref:SbsA Ig-like domain-containing protein n=1 Tax=Leptospira brenneri TaxID=2023182 RepID=A0A5F1Z8H3_9LEPT|nr:Ig-like domain-containing protein [Leptospira brenneri]TGK95709.1 hypothetical protein EHQ30_03470 [Leptospira brenneri]
MSRQLRLPTSLVLVCLWILLGNCYFNPVVNGIINPTVEEEPEAAGAGLLATLATPPESPSPYFFLVSSIPADGEDSSPPINTLSFTFSEELDVDASNGSAWITANIIQNQSINFGPTVTLSDRKFDLSVNFGINTGNTYTITFGSGVKVKSGKPISPGTKVTFTCSGCPGA